MTSRILRACTGILLVGMFRCVGYEPGIELELEYRAEPSAREDLVLDEASVSILAVELVECDSFAFDWRMPVARAHAPVETEHTIAFDAMSEPAVFGGVMLPQPGRYCGLRLHLAPQPMRDAHTFLLAGTLHDEPFVAFSDEAIDVELDCDVPLELDDASRTIAAIAFEPSRWLDDSGSAHLDPDSFRCRFEPAP